MNIDEAGVRIDCPPGEVVVVPSDVTQLYTKYPENRKSVTIIETIKADGSSLPPFLIAPGQHIMDSWVQHELRGDEWITCSPTGYTNNNIVMEFADHLILHSAAGPDMPWKLLFLDGHESHRYKPFELKCAENNIKLFWYTSHLTHALQPLDVGVFRPWKHWHNMAIQRAIRSLDFEYTLSSFFKDLTKIRKDTMKMDTIVHAFEVSGCWPIFAKAGIKKMREYSKKRKHNEEQDDLPALPPLRGDDIWSAAQERQVLGDRDPLTWSSPSRQKHKKICNQVGFIMEKTQLLTMEHSALQENNRKQIKQKRTSRRHVHKGGAGASIATLREQINSRDEVERGIQLKRAERALQLAISRQRKLLSTQGIEAHKQNRARLTRIADAQSTGELLPLWYFTPIRQPDKEPTVAESLLLMPEGHEALYIAVQQLQQGDYLIGQGQEEPNVNILCNISRTDEESEIIADLEEGVEDIPSDEESDSDDDSIDSIGQQASFVGFY